MRVLYGVVGEGMGHAVRSRVVIDHLVEQGHHVVIAVSGRAHDWLYELYSSQDRVHVERIEGMHLVYSDNQLRPGRSAAENLLALRERYDVNRTARRAVEALEPSVVISDFESWSWYYGRRHQLPVLVIDNIHVIDRCRHPKAFKKGERVAFAAARASAAAKTPGAYHYLVSSFFPAEVDKPRTTLTPPILRPEILRAERRPGDHLLVYQSVDSQPGLLDALQQLNLPIRFYGVDRSGTEGNIEFRAFSNEGFVADLASAKGVVAGGGFSLMSECVHLGVPLLSVPLGGQFEQMLNSRWLEHLGYGQWTQDLNANALRRFVDALPQHTEALSSYAREDNSRLLSCVDELLEHARLDEPPPEWLEAEL